MSSLKRYFQVSWMVLALAGLAAGCDSLQHVSHKSPSEPVAILLSGECHTDGQIIICQDSSSSIPGNHLVSIGWSVFNSTNGFLRENQQKSPGDQVSFRGLGTGTYQVTQQVRASDGGTAERVYPSLSITR